MTRDSLLLWDIDGTLICTDRAGERTLLEILRAEYQHDSGEKLPVELAGRTDTSIFLDLMSHLKQDAGPKAAAHFQKTYLSILPEMLKKSHARLHPGIRAALDAVREHPEIHQALLTGNLREGARLKLSHVGIWDYFEFGAFADDSSNRNELGPFALARAKEILGIEFPPERVWIIGDTPHDIACGKVIGAKTIAVATGSFTAEQLRAHEPTCVFEDLSDTAKLLELVLNHHE